MKVQFSSQWNNFFLDLRTEKWNKIMVLASVLQFSRLKKRSPKKDKASTGFETVPSRYLLIVNATISSPSTDHINLKIFLKKMLFWRTILPISSNQCFAIDQKSDLNRSKSHLNSPFMEFFSLHKTTFFVATHTGDQLIFIATQPKSSDSSPPSTQAINDDNDW